MGAFRKILAWLLLASYVFANTLAAALHDHQACCGHSAAGQHHCGSDAHHHADEGLADHDHDHDSDELHAPHDCAICEFLAHAPLAAPVADLIPSGDLPPVECRGVPLQLPPTALAGRHLPRGPPAVS